MKLRPVCPSTALRADLSALRSLSDFGAWRARAAGRPVDLSGLGAVLDRHPALAQRFFAALPGLLEPVDALDQAFPDGVPLLLPGRPETLALPRQAGAGLLVHLLLGTLPDAAALHAALPHNDLSRVLSDPAPQVGAKLAAWLQFLCEASEAPLSGELTLTRRAPAWHPSPDDWRACDRPLTPLQVVEGAGIEEAHGCLQVDFANRYPGGGVLGRGCVQEELRFAMSPELLLSTLLCPALGDEEVVVVHGAAHAAAIEGYGGRARYVGPHEDGAPVGPDGTPLVEVVVMDAVPFRGGPWTDQLHPVVLRRELTKAWVGFSPSPHGRSTPVATGNWGCGVFGGHLPLKAVIQWLAASWHGRPVRYHPFGDPRLGALGPFAAAAWDGLSVGRLFARLEALGDVHPPGPSDAGAPLPDGRSLYDHLLEA